MNFVTMFTNKVHGVGNIPIYVHVFTRYGTVQT